MHDRVRPGDRLDVAAPRGTFILSAVRRAGPADERRCGCDAGAGDAPCAGWHQVQPRRLVAAWRPQPRRRSRSRPSRARCFRHCRLRHRYVCYSRPGRHDAAGRDYQTAGRLTASVLATLDLPRNCDAYICGPAGFMAETSAALLGLGVDATQIRTEFFGPAPAITPGVIPTPTRRHTIRTVRRPTVRGSASPAAASPCTGTRAMQACWTSPEACDVPTRWSCRTGVCHTCETSLLSGTIGYAPDPVDNPADGNVLICCSQPVDDTVLDM